MKLPITSNSVEVNTESLAVPKVSLVCLSFRASSQVRTIPYILQWNQGNLSLAFMKISVAVLLVKLSKQELHLHDAVFLTGESLVEKYDLIYYTACIIVALMRCGCFI